MLILDRKLREKVLIKNTETNEIISVSIAQIRKNVVKIAINAPKNYAIVREEIKFK